jgi:hypothetical protein
VQLAAALGLTLVESINESLDLASFLFLIWHQNNDQPKDPSREIMREYYI